MKLTKSYLKHLIEEEISNINEKKIQSPQDAMGAILSKKEFKTWLEQTDKLIRSLLILMENT